MFGIVERFLITVLLVTSFGNFGLYETIEQENCVIVLEAMSENVSENQMDIAVSVVRNRLDVLGYTEATILRHDEKKLAVKLPCNVDFDEVGSFLCKPACLKFIDADGNIVITSEDISSAEVIVEDVDGSGVMQNCVQITLKKESVTKFSEATKVVAQKAAEQKNYMSIMFDDSVISSPVVGIEYALEGITTEIIIIDGNFDNESAGEFVNLINSGQIPFALEVAEVHNNSVETTNVL